MPARARCSRAGPSCWTSCPPRAARTTSTRQRTTPRSSSSSRASDRASANPGTGALTLTGAGPEASSSAGDQRVRGDDGYVHATGTGRLNVLDLQVQIRRLPKPVIAMVAGYAIGGGHVLHVVCDLTI